MINPIPPLVHKGLEPIPVIPTVYTDALSYGEQTGIMVKKIDECVDKVNEVVEDNAEFKTDISSQQESFETNIQTQIDTFENDITTQQNTFEINITEQQNTYEETTTNELNTWKQNTTNDLNSWKQNTTNGFQSQINEMQNDYDEFLAEFEQEGEVTQNPYGENTLVVTSQKAVNDALRRYNGLNNLLFGGIPHYNKYYRADQAQHEHDNNAYTYFEISLTGGTTYYFSSSARFVSSGTNLLYENATQFTPASTGTYYITFNINDEWKIATTNNFQYISGFKSPSFSRNQLKQNTGNDDSIPMSQRATSEYINAEINRDIALIDENILLARNQNNKNLVYDASEIRYGYIYNGSQFASNIDYCVVIIDLTANETYYFDNARFIATENELLYQNVSQFTPSSTGTYYISLSTNYSDTRNRIIIAKTNTLDFVQPYNIPIFTRNNLCQDNGSSLSVPMSQNAVMNAVGKYFGINNLLFKAKVKYNYYYRADQGGEGANTGYSYFTIFLNSGTTYYFGSNARFVSTSAELLEQNVSQFTPSADGIYYISFANTVEWKMALSNNFDGICGYNTTSFSKKQLKQSTGSDEGIPMSQKAVTDAIQSATQYNIMNNKKWCACGDSFTVGDFTGASNYTFTEGRYTGQKKVYPYWIGTRANMDITVIGAGGMTMATYDSETNVFSASLYQTIPLDSDYVTFKFGINDNHHNIPIGTLSDTNTSTFYGAWNTVLAWVRNNLPTAKVGIIVTNGLEDADGDDYATAIKNVAEKYGIPYIDEWSGKQVPLLLRTGKTWVAQTVRTKIYETFRVSSTNAHPNVACHEFESKFLEDWLKTL